MIEYYEALADDGKDDMKGGKEALLLQTYLLV